MPRRRDRLAVALTGALALTGGCTPHGDAPAKRDNAATPTKPAAPPPAPPRTLDTLQMQVPDGWQATYDKVNDAWRFTTRPLADGRAAFARIDRANPHTVASPDAYLNARLAIWDKGTTADFEKRESVKGGFAMTILMKRAADPSHPWRSTYVVRELGSVYYECFGEQLPDDATRDQLLALCKSLKL